MGVDLHAVVCFAGACFLASGLALGSGAPAQAQYRYPLRLPLDHRPALSQGAVGALSLGILTAGAAEIEYADGCPPMVFAYPPPPGFAFYP